LGLFSVIDAGIVDKHIDGTMRCLDSFDEAIDHIGVGQVGHVGGSPDPLGHLAEVILGACRHHHRRPRIGIRGCQGRTYPPRPTCDHYLCPLEFHGRRT